MLLGKLNRKPRPLSKSAAKILVCMILRVSECVCVCEREIEKERERERERERE